MANSILETAVRKKYRELTLNLIKNNTSITTMESCTSGQIASLITDTEGSSAVMKGAFITYSNEAKVMQGVPVEIIEKYGVYSKETAMAMAEAAMRAYGADVAIGATGSMGNTDPVNDDSVPGEVYYAIATYSGMTAFFEQVPVQDTRLDYKLYVADLIVDSLNKILFK